MSERPTEALRYAAAKYGNECGCRGTDDECAAWDQVQEESDALDATLAAKDRRIAELEASKSGVPHNAVCLFQDGNAWCAVFGDFTNLQESPAGFGDTYSEAITALQKESKKRQWWPDEESK